MSKDKFRVNTDVVLVGGMRMDGSFNTVSLPREWFPPTPPKGEPMPQTREYWEKRAAMDLDLIMEQKEEISRLKQTVNNLRQKLKT